MSPETTPQSGSAARKRLLAAAVLIAATFAAGVAARVGPQPPPTRDALQIATSHAGGPVAVEARLDRSSVLEGSDGIVRMELVLRGAEPDGDQTARVPTDLVVVLDRSGSMEGEPIAMAKAAAGELVAGLDAQDRFALVSYANGARLDAPLAHAGPEAREGFRLAIGAIAATGGTHMASGLDLAHAIVSGASREGRVARVILLSDGRANQGDHSIDGLRSRASRAVAAEYVVSSVGIGGGFDENVMSAVADAGTGNFYYLPNLHELAGIFSDEFAAARETIASGLEVVLALAPDVELQHAAGYPLTHDDGRVRFHPGALFAGQERRIWLTLRAPTASPGDVEIGALEVAYSSFGSSGRVGIEALPQLACVEAEDDYYASFDSEVFKRGSSSAIGQLKEQVARKLQSGDREAAVEEVRRFQDEMQTHQLRALGYAVESDASELSDLYGTVAAPSAAEPSVANGLGKQLFEAGRDAQRSGAKRR
jgi:Ca-activated chloride channel family protein